MNKLIVSLFFVSLTAQAQKPATPPAATAATPAATTPAAAASAQEEKSFKEGKWEMKINVSMAGAPNMQLPVPPSMTQYHCLKRGKVDPKQAHRLMIDKSCAVKDVQYSGQTINWKMNCVMNGMPTEGSGTMTNLETTTGGSTEMWMNLPQGMTLKIMTKMAGKWIAPNC